MKIQWTVGLKEGGIKSSEMIEAGLRKCRKHTQPWIPSVGQFVEWCKTAQEDSTGFPREAVAKQALLNEIFKPMAVRDWGRYHPAVWYAYSKNQTFTWKEMNTAEFNKEFHSVWEEIIRMQREGFDFHSALPKPDGKSDVKTAPVPTGARREELWDNFKNNLFGEEDDRTTA